MNKSLEFVIDYAEKYNKSVINEDASWSVVDYHTQLDKNGIGISEGDSIGVYFEFKETKTDVKASIKYDPDANFRSMSIKGDDIANFRNLEEAKEKLSMAALNYFMRGEWISEKVKRRGAPIVAEFRVGDFVFVTEDYEDTPIIMAFLPVTLDMKLEEDKYIGRRMMEMQEQKGGD